MNRVHDDITLVLTSCNRFDLLERTLQSMHPWLEEIACKIIVEDSDADPALFERLRASGYRIIVNGRRLGQLTSIDIAYAECRTEFILHCEDDWEFVRRPNLEAARRILTEGIEGEGEFSVVCFRDVTGTKRSRGELFRERVVEGSRFLYSFEQEYKFNYFTFNPGMLRHDFYRRYGPWSRYTNERSIARMMMQRGHCIARELPGNVRHIGKDRSRVRSRRFRWIRDVATQWLGAGGVVRGE